MNPNSAQSACPDHFYDKLLAQDCAPGDCREIELLEGFNRPRGMDQILLN